MRVKEQGLRCPDLYFANSMSVSAQTSLPLRLLWGTMVAFLLQAFGQIVGLLHSSPSIYLPQRLLWALGTGGGGGAPFLGEVFLRTERRGCTVLWLVPLGEPRRRPWTRDLGDFQGYLFPSQNLPLQIRLKCTHLPTRSKLTFYSQWGDMVSGLCQRRGFDSENSQSYFLQRNR